MCRRKLTKGKRRREEISRLIKKLYESYAADKIPENHFSELLTGYDAEQKNLDTELERLQAEIDRYNTDSVRADRFLELVKRHTEFTELTPTLLNEFVEKAKDADGFVFATPVYFAHPSGRIFDFLDRAFYSSNGYENFKFKPGAAVAIARRGGTTASLDALNKYFGIAQMPTAGSTYWNMVHGLTAEDAPKDEEGMQTMRNLAKNMIWMMRCFEAGKKAGVPYPDTEKQFCTNFIR